MRSSGMRVTTSGPPHTTRSSFIRKSRPASPGWQQRGFPYNPRGCWDWWGYTGTDYATKTGVQIVAIVAMVERLGQKR
jgi:hypothetical protein